MCVTVLDSFQWKSLLWGGGWLWNCAWPSLRYPGSSRRANVRCATPAVASRWASAQFGPASGKLPVQPGRGGGVMESPAPIPMLPDRREGPRRVYERESEIKVYPSERNTKMYLKYIYFVLSILHIHLHIYVLYKNTLPTKLVYLKSKLEKTNFVLHAL